MKKLTKNEQWKIGHKKWKVGKISDRGFWVGEEVKCQHSSDNHLAKGISSFLTLKNAKSVLDFGCGHGAYVYRLREDGFECFGYDGNPSTLEIIEQKLGNKAKGLPCKVLDLTKSFSVNKGDWVLCLEVGEHIPEKYEEILIENIHKHNRHGIILSWAVPGQGGFGHVNCRSNEYIKNKFLKLGYWNNIEAEKEIRESAQKEWFKNTVMVFER